MINKQRALYGWLVAVSVLACIDAVCVRSAHGHWAPNTELLFGMLALWAGLVSGALIVLLVWQRLRKSNQEQPLLGSLLALTALPIACHSVLDSYMTLGANAGGLRSVWPWIYLVLVGALVVGLGCLVNRVIGRKLESPSRAAVAVILSCGIGASLPTNSAFTGPAPDADAKLNNVVMIVVDTVRAGSMEAFGGDRETSPNLTALAESGMRFGNTRSVSNFTFTSHLSMLTGVYPSEHGAWLMDMNYKPERAPHVAELMNTAGFRTGAFVGTNVLAANTGIGWGFEVFDDRVDPGLTYGYGWGLIHDLQSVAAKLVPSLNFNGRPHIIQDFQRPGDGSFEAAKKWIAQAEERPFFCLINLYDAHWPYLPGGEFEQRMAADYSGPVSGFAERADDLAHGYEFTAADDAYLTDLYEAEILELDAKLGQFFASLDLSTTAVLVVADHGEAFGEGDRYEHNDVLEPQVHIPLIVRPAGGLEQGIVSQADASGVDVASTLLGLAGLPVPESMRGFDLAHQVPPADRIRLVEDRDHLSPDFNHFAIYRGAYKFVRVGAKAEGAGLFDLGNDPATLVDLSLELPELAAEMSALLDSERARWGAAHEELKAAGAAADGLGDLGYLGE